MGTYSYEEFREMFGGDPMPGEAHPSLEQIDLLRKARRENPIELARDDAPRSQRAFTSGDDAPRLARSNASRPVETTAAESAPGKAAPRQGCSNCGAPADVPCAAWCQSEQGS